MEGQGQRFCPQAVYPPLYDAVLPPSLEHVLALQEYDGYMDLVLQISPQQGNLIDALRQEHDQFRKEASHIVHQFEHALPTDGDSFARSCAELAGLLNRLDVHNKKEMALLQEAFVQDEGGQG